MIPFLSSDPEIMAELWTRFLRTNTGIDHICYLKTLERCYFVQIILLSHLCPRNKLQCINYRFMRAKSQQKATWAFRWSNQNACDGQCALSAEKTAESRSKSSIGCLNTPISSNGKRFWCSKSWFGWVSSRLGHCFRAQSELELPGKAEIEVRLAEKSKSTRRILCDTIVKTTSRC